MQEIEALTGIKKLVLERWDSILLGTLWPLLSDKNMGSMAERQMDYEALTAGVDVEKLLADIDRGPSR